MSEYAVGTVLEDCDEDRWTVQAGGRAKMSGGEIILNTSSLEGAYGPLTVVEEPSNAQIVNGLGEVVREYYTSEDIPELVRPEGFSSFVPRAVTEKAQASSGASFPQDAFNVYNEAFNILLKKNADYGPSNIADSPGGPLNGILVRMWDKMSRLRHLVESGATPENESLRDTLMDMANYSLIAMIVLDGNWPGMEDK